MLIRDYSFRNCCASHQQATENTFTKFFFLNEKSLFTHELKFILYYIVPVKRKRKMFQFHLEVMCLMCDFKMYIAVFHIAWIQTFDKWRFMYGIKNQLKVFWSHWHINSQLSKMLQCIDLNSDIYFWRSIEFLINIFNRRRAP